LEQFNAGKPVHFVIRNNSDWLLDAVKNARHLELIMKWTPIIGPPA
jgi:hypothetical protein